MSDALLEAMTGLAADEAVRAIVVTGRAHGIFRAALLSRSTHQHG